LPAAKTRKPARDDWFLTANTDFGSFEMSAIGCATYAVPARAFSDVILRLAERACYAAITTPSLPRPDRLVVLDSFRRDTKRISQKPLRLRRASELASNRSKRSK
jgi:hypothetical protein